MIFMSVISERFATMPPENVLIVVSVLDMFSAGIISPRLANRLRLLGGTHILVGVMKALYYSSQLISTPLVGSFSDLKSRKSIMILCMTICGISYLLLGLVSSVFTFLFMRALIGLTKHTQFLTTALNAEYTEKTNGKPKQQKNIISSVNIAFCVGPIFGGHIMETFPRTGFTVITTIIAFIFAINLSLIPSLPDLKQEKKEPKNETSSIILKLIESVRRPLKESAKEFYKIDWTLFADVFAANTLMTLCTMMYYGNYVLFLTTKYSLSRKHVGYIIALKRLIGFLSPYFIRHINQFYKNDADLTRRNHHVFLTITLMLIGLTSASNIYICTVILMSLAIAISMGTTVTLEIICKSNNEHVLTGASNSIRCFSGVFTPLVAGVINQYLGVVYVVYTAALYTAIGSVITYRLRLKSIDSKTK